MPQAPQGLASHPKRISILVVQGPIKKYSGFPKKERGQDLIRLRKAIANLFVDAAITKDPIINPWPD